MYLFLTLLALLTFVFSFARNSNVTSKANQEVSLPQYSTREERIIALLRIRIPAFVCPSFLPVFSEGYCDGLISCFSYAGSVSGTCVKSGVCCVVKRRCGEQLFSRVGYFLNRKFPKVTTASGECSVRINRYRPEVTQIRLDFIQFELDQPNSNGICSKEKLTITGTDPAFNVPVICGNNTGQQMYINYAEQATLITLIVTLDGSSESIFNIKITQFRANNPEKAPDGCLQYFTEPSGTVSSFNFNGESMQHLSNQFYDVCISKPNAMCPITWTPVVFDVSNAMLMPANPDKCVTDMFDYVNIPKGQIPSTTPGTPLEFINAICGSFPSSVVTTDSRLQIVFNENEAQEGTGQVGRKGFELNYEVDPTCNAEELLFKKIHL